MGRKSIAKKRRSPDLPAPHKRRANARAVAQDKRVALSNPLRIREWLYAAALLAAVLLAYQPAWHRGLIWDDDAHVTHPSLRSWQGLNRIWFDLGATQQYYPLLHSAFWLEHKLWGDDTLGNHLVNLSLHVLAALLVARLLRTLNVPRALLAAAIFALHPIQVESVAWITELKNTLSAVFYLSAAIVYLRFDRTRTLSSYLAALGLFALGLLSKTVVATLPAALLVVFWWQRGRLSWRRDVGPLLPFFIVGAAAGIFTAWVERKLIGAEGAAFDFSFVERCLIAGRAIWFYLAKLCWPTELVFIYPRWHINQAAAWQYLFPLGVLLLLAAFWELRRRTRAPLAALLFFAGTLFPVLGFLNVFPFIFSFVADHFQYLASLGIITLFSAGAALLLRRTEGAARVIGQIGCAALLATLAVLTWRQSRMYEDIDTLYQTTIDSNPDCWMAHFNLAIRFARRGQTDEAISHYQKGLELKPDSFESHNNLGLALAGQARIDEAILHYRRALEIKPDYAEAHNNLGLALAGRGRVDEAIDCFHKALEIKPDFAKPHNNIGTALMGRGQVDAAIAQYRRALEIEPDYAEANNNLGVALAGRGQVDDAIALYRKALEIEPEYADAHNNLGVALKSRGQVDEAIAHYRMALESKPNYADAHNGLGVALAGRGQFDEAIVHYRKALEFKPDNAQVHNDLAVALFAREHVEEAIVHYQKALEISPDILETHYNLGRAYSVRGRIDEALAHYQKALDLASARHDGPLADDIRAKIRQLRN